MLKHSGICAIGKNHPPAAFRRLCVETMKVVGGQNSASPAAFRRLCVETDNLGFYSFLCWNQPPSGGCVLKQANIPRNTLSEIPAAFRRLCVETRRICQSWRSALPAAFRRLCVETSFCRGADIRSGQPPSGGCVLKPIVEIGCCSPYNPAAFRRLCVETIAIVK